MKQSVLLIFCFLVISLTPSRGQQTVTPLTHDMSAEEAMFKGNIGKSFVETDPPMGTKRNIAEFEAMQGALVRYPFGIPYSLIAEMSQDALVYTIVTNATQRATVTTNYTNNGVNLANCRWIYSSSDSYWTRDYGPWFISYGNQQIGIVDFPYNRPRPNDDEIPKKVADSLNIEWFGMNVIHTGGNYMTTGMNMASSSDLVYVENPTLTSAQVDQKMQNYLGINTYHVVADPNVQTTIDHIDCWGKFLAPDKVLIRSTSQSSSEYTPLENTAAYFASQNSPYGTPFKVYRVYTPNGQPYTNSVILNNKVLVPFMGVPASDTIAQQIYQLAMPGYEVLGFTSLSSAPWISSDALHCRVMGIADLGLLYINHMPLEGFQPVLSQYTINADIIPHSHTGLYPDSTLLFYKIDNGAWQQMVMTPTSGFTYTANIPGQPSGSKVYYYIHAADSSGRTANHSLMGIADPHVFEIGTVGIESSLQSQPDIAALGNITPNPFRDRTIIDYTVRTPGSVKLEIVNLQGQLVKSLADGTSGIGHFEINWDGTNNQGNRVAPGVYFCRMSASSLQTTKKLILLP